MPSLPDIARTTVERHDMLPAGSPVLAMVSGGGDSVALLRLLAAGDLGDVRLSVLHVDHALRPSSAEDAAFVESVCAALGVPCRVVRYDVAAIAAEQGLNLEDAGRRVRYRFAEEELDAQCARLGVPPSVGRIAVAHTFDDRMETFLMRLLTGAGAGGLTAPRHVRGRIVRPLLDARREAVRAYVRELGQSWREDESNLDTSRLRARIRHDLLPLAFDVNPRFDVGLARTLGVLEDEDALLGQMAEGFAYTFAEVQPGRAVFARTMMATLSRAMARRTMRSALAIAFPEAGRLDFEHIEALAEAAVEESPAARDLPFGLRMHTEYGTMIVARPADTAQALAPSLLEIPGIVSLGEAGTLEAREVAAHAGVPDDPFHAMIDAEPLIDAEGNLRALTIDGPRDGDRMRPLGMAGTKKLSDLLTDEKVPRGRRPATPVVRDGERIVWVAGVRLADDYKVTSDTRRAVSLKWDRERTD